MQKFKIKNNLKYTIISVQLIITLRNNVKSIEIILITMNSRKYISSFVIYKFFWIRITNISSVQI